MTLIKSSAPKHTNDLNVVYKPALQILAVILLLTTIICPNAIINQSMAQNPSSLNNCNGGYAETWIVGRSCFVGQSVDVKTDDAIHISCHANNAYSIAFFVEPAGSDPSTSNAVQHDVCPGNGYITNNADGEEVLRCSFWESADNVAKQLEVKLQTAEPAEYGNPGRTMNWKVTELDNPNVVCGVSGRPGDEGETAGSGRTT